VVVRAYRLEAELDGGLDLAREMVDVEPLAAQAHDRKVDAEPYRPSMASRELCVN
jgi:hypothetical protein